MCTSALARFATLSSSLIRNARRARSAGFTRSVLFSTTPYATPPYLDRKASISRSGAFNPCRASTTTYTRLRFARLVKYASIRRFHASTRSRFANANPYPGMSTTLSRRETS